MFVIGSAKLSFHTIPQDMCLFPPFNFQGIVLHRGTREPYFYDDVMSVQLPPLDTDNQI